MPGASPIGASRRGAASPAVKSTSVSGGRPRALILQKPFERFEEPARPAGEIGAGLVARALAGEALDREAHARLVGGERQLARRRTAAPRPSPDRRA